MFTVYMLCIAHMPFFSCFDNSPTFNGCLWNKEAGHRGGDAEAMLQPKPRICCRGTPRITPVARSLWLRPTPTKQIHASNPACYV